jgi:DNA-binding response OmpR family regulator
LTRPELKTQMPQRTAIHAADFDLAKIMFSLPPCIRRPAVHPDRCQKFRIELLLCGATEVYSEAWVRHMETVLIIEDSRPMQRTLQRLFEADSLGVRIASDGEEGLESFRQEPPNVVILDLKLPGLSGKELCRSFKAEMPSVPIVVLSANADVDDKVVLLELGADDYVTKPFSPKELLARVRRAMRRNIRKQQTAGIPEGASPHDLLLFGDVEIDFTSMEAKRTGKPVSMTAQEFKLLRFLSRSTDRVISREELLNEVWGYQNYPSTRTVDNHILRLRQKLEPDPARPRFFVTVHSAGYKFVTGAAAVSKRS